MTRNKEEYNKYMKEYMKNRYKQKRDLGFKILGNKCKNCGSNEQLEFDHIDPKTKLKTIADIWSYSEKKFLEEIAKCQILCKNCHILKSRLNGDLGGGHNKIDNYNHGSGHMYNKDRCRCNLCKEWKRNYRKKLVNHQGQVRVLGLEPSSPE